MPANDHQRLSPPRGDRSAADIMGLISVLDRKLNHYMAVHSGRSVDESSKLLNDAAVVWIQQTLEDLAATVAGIEAASTEPQRVAT